MPSQSEVAAVDTAEPPSLLNVIAKAARDPNVDVGKLTALIGLQERVAANQARSEYLRDLALVASEIEPVRKDATNPTFSRKYATLGAIDAAVRPAYSRHGFSVGYGTVPAPAGSVGVSCTVAHRGGHVETLSLIAPSDTTTGGRSRTPVQAIGSTVTYLRRYLLTMALGVTFAEDDDDGERTRPQQPPPKPETRPRVARTAPPYTPAPPPPAPEPPPQGDFLTDGEQLDYRIANSNGGIVVHSGSDWIAAWKGMIAACQQNNKLDRLLIGVDMNAAAFEAIRAFDPQAVAEVQSLLAAALSAVPSHEEMARTGK